MDDRAELLAALEELALAGAYETEPGVYYSGCLSHVADAMRLLARYGVLVLLEDGPGRHCVARKRTHDHTDTGNAGRAGV